MSQEVQPIPRQGEVPAPTAFRRLAVCLDGSELGERVLPHAFAVARAFGAPVTLLRALEGGTSGEGPSDPLDWELRRKEAGSYLDRLADRRSDERATIRAEVIEGAAAEQICLWAEHHEVDLTVFSSHGNRGISECRLAGTASKLIERAPGSLLLVPALAAPSEGIARYRKILVPLDGSARAESVLPLATRLAADAEADLVLAHVVPVPELIELGALEAEDLELRDRLVRRNERVANQYLDRVRARLAESRFPVRAIVLRGGDVRGRLIRLIADLAIDLIVLSAHGQTGRADVHCGSVAAHLLSHSTVPLLIVRPARARSQRPAANVEGAGCRLPQLASA